MLHAATNHLQKCALRGSQSFSACVAGFVACLLAHKVERPEHPLLLGET